MILQEKMNARRDETKDINTSVDNINQPLSKLDEKLYHAQKMESLGALAGGMAHDMNNVLASIMAVASAMEAEMTADNPFADDVKVILNACKRGSNLTRSLLGFARRQRMNATVVSINKIVKEVKNILTHTLPVEIDIVLNLDTKLKNVMADEDQLNHILINICLNAADAMKGAGTLTIETQNIHISEQNFKPYENIPTGDFVSVSVTDTGPGIPEEIENRIFEPFFTTKPKGKGTGLGLSMAYGIIKKHGGRIKIAKGCKKGAKVIVELPAVNEKAKKQTMYARSPITEEKKGTILLVDDEDLFRTSSKRILGKLGYKVIDAKNGKEAIELFKKTSEKIDMVILDMIMPVMDGRKTFFELKKLDSQISILIASGFTEEASIKDLMDHGAIGFLGKPFDMQSLSSILPGIKNNAI
jgi:signal transduction histidine kinase/CheY-like chemotaxis protein